MPGCGAVQDRVAVLPGAKARPHRGPSGRGRGRGGRAFNCVPAPRPQEPREARLTQLLSQEAPHGHPSGAPRGSLENNTLSGLG